MMKDSEQKYHDLLRAWCDPKVGAAPAEAEALARAFFDEGLSPDQIVMLHTGCVLKGTAPDDARAVVAAQHLLLQIMIAYGQAHLEQGEAAIARERQEKLAAEAEARELLDLLANVTHELGTPLTVLQGNIAALRKLERPSDLLPSDIAQSEADIDAALTRMMSLREQLMAANREPATLEFTPLLFDHHVERAARWAERALREKGLDLVLELACPGSMISADEQALQSILDNLLSNAVRYTPPGGTVTCTTRATESALTLEVSDTGIGMSDEVRAHVFDRFYRSKEAKRMAGFGLGLGLSLTRSLVEAMGATIEVTSSPGKGSTFSVRFPRLQSGDAP